MPKPPPPPAYRKIVFGTKHRFVTCHPWLCFSSCILFKAISLLKQGSLLFKKQHLDLNSASLITILSSDPFANERPCTLLSLEAMSHHIEVQPPWRWHARGAMGRCSPLRSQLSHFSTILPGTRQGTEGFLDLPEEFIHEVIATEWLSLVLCYNHLEILIFEQGALHFHFALGPQNNLADPNCIIGLYFIIYSLKLYLSFSTHISSPWLLVLSILKMKWMSSFAFHNSLLVLSIGAQTIYFERLNREEKTTF